MKQIPPRYCQKCGKPIFTNQRFCPDCRKKVGFHRQSVPTKRKVLPYTMNVPEPSQKEYVVESTISASSQENRDWQNEKSSPRYSLRHDEIAPGFGLRCLLRGFNRRISQIAWSDDGLMLAASYNDEVVVIWNIATGQIYRELQKDQDYIIASWKDEWPFGYGSNSNPTLCWSQEADHLLRNLNMHPTSMFYIASPDGRMFATSRDYGTVRIWDEEAGQLLSTLEGHRRGATSIAWSPDSQIIATCADGDPIRIWNVETSHSLAEFSGYTDQITCMSWSPDGQTLASGSTDSTVSLWEKSTGRVIRILEGHTASIICVSFSSDGLLFASKSKDGTIRLWRSDTWEAVAILDDPSYSYYTGLAFYRRGPVLATLSEEDMAIRIWDISTDVFLNAASTASSVSYANAKVVLVGDSGVGKSGLGLVLSNQPFAPTESTHGRHVWTFDTREIQIDKRRKEMRETLLWDLAGQPGYRLIHQLHLNEVAVALVVFDARSETDPFTGVHHWDRALRSALRLQGNSAPPMKKFLVSARVDCGGRGVSQPRIDKLIREIGFDGFFETSAKDGQNIRELAIAIRRSIPWNVLPRVSSTDLFQSIKSFLVREKEAGRLLSTINDLYSAFVQSDFVFSDTSDLRAQFEVCIGRVESRGLIRRLSFGKLVLLQPELLDSYASALVNAVKDEPDGLGSIVEERVIEGDFFIPKDECIEDKELEKLLLIAMTESLLSCEIALREQSNEGQYLVFPSQSTRENPELPNPEGPAIIFSFQGPVFNIYATLAVRLSHCGFFKKKDLWKNAVTYSTEIGGLCGIFLRNLGEGQGELMLFFDKAVSEETSIHFERYIYSHLQNRALQGTIKRHRIFVCSECGFIVPNQLVQLRSERNLTWLNCPACEKQRISLLDGEERLTSVPVLLTREMDRVADVQRNLEAAKSVLQGKIETNDFDVFLCHNHKDKSFVKQIGEKLKEQGILPWLDEWELRPGFPWQRVLEQQIGQIKSAAVFVGNDLGPWQQEELEAFLREFTKRGCPIIPVLLPDIPQEPEFPPFLSGRTWVDFRTQFPDPLNTLIWGITGKPSPNR